jgi:hypothetical protein
MEDMIKTRYWDFSVRELGLQDLCERNQVIET